MISLTRYFIGYWLVFMINITMLVGFIELLTRI